jgi:putative protease
MEYRIKPELLSPCGDQERLISAVQYGADAVYLAGKLFGMRRAPSNFDEDGLKWAVDYCHNYGVKVYVTCNTLPRNHELAVLPNFLQSCEKIGVDAFIVTDLGVLEMAKQYAPKVELHVSTQAGVVNYAGANAFYHLGAKRVVLAREVPLSEIREIRQNIPDDLELEAFVHGAMCMSFSGRCLMSNYMTGRDANRGECAQPCRWEYFVTERQRPGEQFPVIQEEEGAYIFSSKDMCMIRHLPEMIEAGISSLKIEGRAKSAYYVASATAAYRQAIDFVWEHPGEPLPESIAEETEKLSHREYSTGFYLGTEPGQVPGDNRYIRNYEVVAVCEENKDGVVKLSQRGRFFKGETADVLQPGEPSFTAPLEEIYNGEWEPIEVAPHAEMVVYWKTDAPIKPGAYLRICRK